MSDQDIIARVNEDVQQQLAPVMANFQKVIASIESGERLLPLSENVLSYTTIYNIATSHKYGSVLPNCNRTIAELLYNHFQEMLAAYARRLSAASASLPTATSAATASAYNNNSDSNNNTNAAGTRLGTSSTALKGKGGGANSSSSAATGLYADERFSKVSAWGKFRSASRWACVVFRYLGSFFLNDNKGGRRYPPLDDAARAVFYNCCLKKHLAETRRAIFDLITSSRDGDQITLDILKSSVEMFEKMSIPSQPTFFEEQFLVPFTDATSEYFDRWSANRTHCCSASEYILLCGRVLSAEADRYKLLFSQRHHRNRLLDAVEAALLDNRAARDLIFKSPTGLRSLLRKRDFATASIAFNLLATKSKRIEPLADMVSAQLEEDGRAQLDAYRTREQLNPHDCVTRLYELHEAYTKLLHDHFKNNIIVARSVQSALERIMSEGFKIATASKAAASSASSASPTISTTIPISDILAQYCDYCIRQQDKITMPLDQCFDQAVALLMFTTNKDLCQLRARDLLAKRLLSPGASAPHSEASEQLLISKFKRACGSQFTSHFESMLADRSSSTQLHTKFLAYLSDHRDRIQNSPIRMTIDFSTLVLKMGIWPIKPDDQAQGILTIPREVAIGIKHFVDFYKSESSRRVLKWLHNYSNAVITAKLPRGTKELSMNAFQAGILLNFNNANNSNGATTTAITLRTIVDLKAATNLHEDQVRRAIDGLCRVGILLPATAEQIQQFPLRPHPPSSPSSPASASVTSPVANRPSAFVVNENFANNNRKILVPSMALNRLAAGSNGANSGLNDTTEQLMAVVEEQRKPVIQTCIVTLMKSRRQMPHQELLAEVMRFLTTKNFSSDAGTVKEQIETLIDRGVVGRHPSEQGVYVYIA